MLKELSLIIIMFNVIACSSTGTISDETIFDERDAKPAKPLYAPRSVLERRAYEEGVKQILSDFKGKYRAERGFVYEPAKIQCGVEIPGRVVGGALIPQHSACVMLKPGGYVQKESILYPNLDQ